jgi:hypothetical protein
MDNRKFESGASASPPSAPASPSSGYPTDGNPGTGVPATIPGSYWAHQIGEELRAVIAAAGLTPDHTNLDQLLAALNAGWGMAKSINTSGYLTLPGGIIIQWGEATTNASGVANVTLPIAFPNAILTIGTNDGEAVASSVAYGGVNKNGLTGITLTYARGAAAVNAAAVFWFAIGY